MTDSVRRRARTAEEFGEITARLFVPEEIMASIAGFRPRPSDVIISPFGKCGTTWLQQIFHSLRTRGDMDFEDISAVVPWIETAALLGIDLDAEQRAEPRGFKSHLPSHMAPGGARYIVSLRDPGDALVSMYRFMEGWFIEPGAVSIAAFAERWLSGEDDGSDYWTHLLGWWERRDDPELLLIAYEQMIDAPAKHVRLVAEFCDIPLDAELLALTLERSSLDFMLARKEKFSDPMMRRASEARCGLPPGSDSAKVRKGGVGGHERELPPEVGERLDAIWAERIAPVLGFADYAALARELGRRHAS
ncbi:MAG: sulfotransferase domain-containing protein [Sphingomonadaceae bacterium]